MNSMAPPLASTSASGRSSDPAPPTPRTAPATPVDPDAWRLGNQVPQTPRRWLRALGWWILRRAGWRFEGQMPDLPKFVVIVAPHTSNWDFPVGLAGKWALGLDCHFWGKDTLFRPPLGWFMRANGGIPVDRRNKHNVVQDTVAAMRAAERFVLVLSPEGTRKKVEAWRSGFWHVAQGAGVPVCCVALDWGRKVIRLGPTTMAEEADASAGIARMRQLFDGVVGCNPGQQT
jgi:1-acyl-sn-glycerol-3-phosphate acyltransferase